MKTAILQCLQQFSSKNSKTKYLLSSRIFMSSLFYQGLFDNPGRLGLGRA